MNKGQTRPPRTACGFRINSGGRYFLILIGLPAVGGFVIR